MADGVEEVMNKGCTSAVFQLDLMHNHKLQLHQVLHQIHNYHLKVVHQFAENLWKGLLRYQNQS